MATVRRNKRGTSMRDAWKSITDLALPPSRLIPLRMEVGPAVRTLIVAGAPADAARHKVEEELLVPSPAREVTTADEVAIPILAPEALAALAFAAQYADRPSTWSLFVASASLRPPTPTTRELATALAFQSLRTFLAAPESPEARHRLKAAARTLAGVPEGRPQARRFVFEQVGVARMLRGMEQLSEDDLEPVRANWVIERMKDEYPLLPSAPAEKVIAVLRSTKNTGGRGRPAEVRRLDAWHALFTAFGLGLGKASTRSLINRLVRPNKRAIRAADEAARKRASDKSTG